MSKVFESLSDDELLNKIITNNFCDGHCSRCGECCGAGPMPLTRAEEKRIRKYIKEHDIKYQPSELYIAKECQNKVDEYLRCCFYNSESKSCLIYDVRPEICRSFRCNMSLNEIEKNLSRCHKRAYWNRITTKPELNKNVHLANFALIFYNRYYDLLKWFMANLKEDSSVALSDLDINDLFNRALNIMYRGGIDVPSILAKLEWEVKQDADRYKKFSDSSNNNDIS